MKICVRSKISNKKKENNNKFAWIIEEHKPSLYAMLLSACLQVFTDFWGQVSVPSNLDCMLSRNLVNKYQPMLCNIPEERRPQQHRGGSFKSRNSRTLMSEILGIFQRGMPYLSVLSLKNASL